MTTLQADLVNFIENVQDTKNDILLNIDPISIDWEKPIYVTSFIVYKNRDYRAGMKLMYGINLAKLQEIYYLGEQVISVETHTNVDEFKENVISMAIDRDALREKCIGVLLDHSVISGDFWE